MDLPLDHRSAPDVFARVRRELPERPEREDRATQAPMLVPQGLRLGSCGHDALVLATRP